MTDDRANAHEEKAGRVPKSPVGLARAGVGGRPSLLTDDVQQRILMAVRNHQRIEVAAELAGVSRSILYGWLSTGARAQIHLAGGGKRSELTALERRCADLSEAIGRAMAIAEGTAINGIIRAGTQPGVETKRTKRCVGLDDGGQPVYAEETTTTERPPDHRALTWWAERRVPAYHLKQSLELTGADGGPLEIEFAVRLAGIEEKIRKHQAAIAAESREGE